jgi:ABC-type transport system substrate-binding protein
MEVAGNPIAPRPSEHTLRTPRDATKRLPQHSLGAGPSELARRKPGIILEFWAFEEYHQPAHSEELPMSSIPDTTTRIAMMNRGEADSIDSVPGEPVAEVKNTRFMKTIGPRAIGPHMGAEKWQDSFPAITTGYAYPGEDIRLKD